MLTPDALRRRAKAQQNAEIVSRMLGEPLRRWSGFTIHLHCQGCREDKAVTVASLTERHGDRLIGEVIDRLRCQVCGQSPERIEMRHHVAVWRVRSPVEE